MDGGAAGEQMLLSEEKKPKAGNTDVIPPGDWEAN